MPYRIKILMWLVLVLSILGCASKPSSYELPSVSAKSQPQWVETSKAVKDTIFVVVHLEKNVRNLDDNIQIAQSQLYVLLSMELEYIVRDYFIQSGRELSEEEILQKVRVLPRALEKMMTHVGVADAWQTSDEISVLCSLDYEAVTHILMSNLKIDDKSFRSYFKRRMDELSTKNS